RLKYGFTVKISRGKIITANPTLRMSWMSTRRGAEVGKSGTVDTALKYACSANTFSGTSSRVIIQSMPIIGAFVRAMGVANEVSPPYAPQNQASCHWPAACCAAAADGDSPTAADAASARTM